MSDTSLKLFFQCQQQNLKQRQFNEGMCSQILWSSDEGTPRYSTWHKTKRVVIYFSVQIDYYYLGRLYDRAWLFGPAHSPKPSYLHVHLHHLRHLHHYQRLSTAPLSSSMRSYWSAGSSSGPGGTRWNVGDFISVVRECVSCATSVGAPCDARFR
jgi:hypothetical protein